MAKTGELWALNPPTPLRNEAAMNPRVHFNPIVYLKRYEEEPITTLKGEMGMIDKNRNKNDMKNGTRKNESFPIYHNLGTTSSSEDPEKVQKVLVTIAVASVASSHNHKNPYHYPQESPIEFQKNVPDLLKTTPLFYRKRRQRHESATAGNSISVPLEDDAWKSNQPAFLPDDEDRRITVSNYYDPEIETNSRSSLLWGWKSGLVQQLQQLKRFVSKKTGSGGGSGSGNSNKPTVTATVAEAEGQEIVFGCEENSLMKKRYSKKNLNSVCPGADGENSQVLTGWAMTTRHNLQQPEPPSAVQSFRKYPASETVPHFEREKFGPRSPPTQVPISGVPDPQQHSLTSDHNHKAQEPKERTKTDVRLSEPFSRNCPERVKTSRSSFHFKSAMDSLHENNATDELSANVDKILEEIADLEDIIDKQCGSGDTAISTPKWKNQEDDVISDFVNECCTVSSALACLTAKSANPLHTSSTSPPTPVVHGMIRKPPLPPSHRIKYLISLNSDLRNQFFQPPPLLQKVSLEASPPHRQQQRSMPLKALHKLPPPHTLDSKLSEVKAELHRSREEISRLSPKYIKEIEESVSLRQSQTLPKSIPNPNPPNRTTSSGWESSSTCSLAHSENSSNDHHHSKYEEENLAKQFNWNAIVTQAKEKLVVSSRSNSFSSSDVGDSTNSPRNKWKSILEPDLDNGASLEIIKRSDPHHSCQSSETVICSTPNSARVLKSRKHSQSQPLSKLVQRNTLSMQNLNLVTNKSATLTPAGTTSGSKDKEDRSRSMEFLLDEEKAQLMPPENALQKSHETRQASEHELRIQRSLQRLNVPDWYKNYATPTTTPGSTPVKTTTREFGSGTGLAGGWSGLSSSSLQSVGRYAGSKTGFSSTRPRGTTPTGGRSSRESLMSPSSTASASPSPYFERSSFTYGMPYALTRFSTRMSCGASPSSLSPSPSPVGGITSSTSTPVSSGPMSRYGYNKTPYLGWRSQERLNSKTLYRSPSERLAADLMSHQKPKPSTPVSTGSDVSIVTSPRKETSSDLSLNISDTSESSNKLNRVRSSIKEVSNAIIDYVNETKPLDEGINGRASPRRGLIWLESSFVGTKPIDSPGTPDTTTSVIMSKHLGAQGSAYLHTKRSAMKLIDHNGDKNKDTRKSPQDSQPAFSTTYLSRNGSVNEKTGEQSNSSSLSSPTLDDILDSLLALRRPQKKIRDKGHKADESSTKDMTTTTPNPPEPISSISSTSAASNPYDIPASDWQQRMNQPLDDTMYFPQNSEAVLLPTFPTAVSLTTTTTTIGSNNTAVEPDNSEMRTSYFDTLRESMGATSGGGNSDDGANPMTTKSPWMDNQNEEDDNSGRIAQEESTFGSPTEILPSMPTLINNPLAGLNENNSTSNPTTPARLRRVSFDLDTSDKDEKSSSRSKKDVDSLGGSIQCKNVKCGKTATGLEARREFKTCHNCQVYYCSRECRRMHWEKHKKVCMQSRVGQLCKQIITHVKDDSFVVSQLSTVAKRGFLAKGRGCVKLFFSSPDRAERFLTGGLPELPEPWYIPVSEMLPEEMGAPTFSELSDSCRTYNSETRFVLYVSVCVVNEVPTSGAVKWEREMISRCSKIRLLIPRSFDENQPHHHAAIPAHLNPEDVDPRAYSPTHHLSSVGGGGGPGGVGIIGDDLGGTILPLGVGGENETLILRSVPTHASLKLNSSDDRRRREVSFTNIQKHLIERGVDLRRTYPDIYSKLCNYVENDEPFLPVTIYPRNSQTGSQFMCVIMPESSDTSYELSSDPLSKVETINISE